MNNNTKRGVTGLFAAVAAPILLLAAGAVTAQDGGGLIQVAEVKVKTGHIQEFTELQRELADAGREAGMTGRGVWQVMHGATNTFHIVEPRPNFAAYDGDLVTPLSDEDWTAWVRRIVPTIDTRSVWTLRTYPDLTIPTEDDYEENLIRLRIRTIKPGMNAEYEAWLRDDLIPALTKGGETGVDWFRVTSGLSTNTWFSVTRHASYAEMDPPGPLQHMGPEGASRLLAKSAGMQTGDNQDLIVRFRPDLSY